MYQNIGALDNSGFEFEIGGEIVRTKNWNYSTSLNLSHNKTTVAKVKEKTPIWKAATSTQRMCIGSKSASR